jgi:hypothetical protein
VTTLVGVAQDQGVNIQCVIEVFSDIYASKRQAIAVAQYIGVNEGGFDPQSGS